MQRKIVGGTEKTQEVDVSQLRNPGVTLLKFGRAGKPHERLFRLTEKDRFLKWYSGWWTFITRKENTSKLFIFLNPVPVSFCFCS
jgi:hypothetical protein